MTDATLYYGTTEYGYREYYGLLYRWRLHPGCTERHKDVVYATPSRPSPGIALEEIQRWMKQHQIEAE